LTQGRPFALSGIVTLTLNPAIDVSTATDRVTPVNKLRCDAGQRDPGGGGINVARVITRLGARSTAIYPAGGIVGQLLKRLVDAEGIVSLAVPVAGETREDFTVLDRSSGEQYRFVLPGPRLADGEWEACLRALASLEIKPVYVCASGSLPPGVPDDAFGRVARTVQGWGGKLVLDTSGAALEHALEGGVYLVKPNLRELRELTGQVLEGRGALIAACRSLIDRGACEVAALTRGAEGALLVTAEHAWAAAALPIRPVSTVGAGDSFLGAMIWGLTVGKSLDESFRYAVAGGSAALLAPGTGLCRAEDVHRLVREVVVEAL